MKLCEVNSSFDSGILRIAYPGKNRNGSFISKQTFERCIESIYNCPIVTNYDRDTDTLGGHDMDVVTDADGNLKLVNLTTPVGVVPESANWFWCENEDDDGVTREYLCAEVILWKRQEAYNKIKNDGVVEQSMEITVKSGSMIDGIYHINDFEFTAFALIGVTPCFQGAALETFSKKDFKLQFKEMMQELKDSYKEIEAFNRANDIKEFSVEGGKALDEKLCLAKEYGIDIESLDFSIEDMSIEELRSKFDEIKAEEITNEPDTSTVNPVVEEVVTDPATEDVTDGDINDDIVNEVADNTTEVVDVDSFELQGNVTDGIIMALEEVKIEREWGESARYIFVDYDSELCEVFCWDSEDWLLYGFKYENNGDNIALDFESKKRMKWSIVDFDEGEQPSPISNIFEKMSGVISEYAEREHGYKGIEEKYSALEEEVTELRKFKEETVSEIAKKERDAILSKFMDLTGDEAFEELKARCEEYDSVTLEDKCFAIRGRKMSAAKFSLENKSTVLKVDRSNLTDNEPYGGAFVKYGVGQNM